MPSSISPNIDEIPIACQDVHLHIWGETSRNGLICAKGMLRSMAERVDMPELPGVAMRPGGVRIPRLAWGDMPSGYPPMLAQVGLSMAWITPPVGDEPRGTYLTDAGMSVQLHVRSSPTRDDCDLVSSMRAPCPDEDQMASLLICLAPLLGARETMSAHQAMMGNRALYLASRATSAAALEAAFKIARSGAPVS